MYRIFFLLLFFEHLYDQKIHNSFFDITTTRKKRIQDSEMCDDDDDRFVVPDDDPFYGYDDLGRQIWMPNGEPYSLDKDFTWIIAWFMWILRFLVARESLREVEQIEAEIRQRRQARLARKAAHTL
jgi:hypothetical protein